MRRALVLLALLVSCRRPKTDPAQNDAAPSPSTSASVAVTRPEDLLTARIAEDRRDSAGVPAVLATSDDVVARRASARALAEIADASAIERLGKALSDDDPEVVAWAAYGLGLPCDVDPDLGRDDRSKIVRAIAARALTFEQAKTSGTPRLDPWSAMAWSLGRCGGLDASRELARWLGRDVSRARAATFALGAIAQRDRGLEDDVVGALLAAASGGEASVPLDEALFPFGRGDWSSRPPTPRLAEIARPRLGTPSPTRIFVIRAVGRSDAGKPEDLRGLLVAADTSPAERVEALRALHRLGPLGDAEIAAFATRNAPTDEAKTNALSSASFGSLRVAVELLGERATATNKTSLRAFVGGTPISASTPAPTARRLVTLRCLAAAGLHPGAPGEANLVRCSAHDPSLPLALRAELETIREDARLSSAERGEVTGDRRELVVRLAKDAHPRIRERALGILAKHVEAAEAPDVLIKGLGAKSLGVVAATAQAIAERPSLANGISKNAIKAALDPKSPPPEAIAVHAPELDAGVLKALDGALARPLEEADAETKIALASAVGALKHTTGRGFVLRLCGDRGPALRRAARSALERLDPPGKASPCNVVVDHGAESPHVRAPRTVRVVAIETDAGAKLKLSLDPIYAPVTVARIAELVGAGFFDGTPIHRVVPGFVAQFGDPGGDGYGGAHSALRCETAPVPFAPLDIGVALAGRDTGSSQIFVMLGRAPHLDGSYSWIGRAEGPWDTIAEGDLVVRAKTEASGAP